MQARPRETEISRISTFYWHPASSGCLGSAVALAFNGNMPASGLAGVLRCVAVRCGAVRCGAGNVLVSTCASSA